MRIAALGFSHESNTYAPVPATLEQWQNAGFYEGDDIVAEYGGSQATMGGYLELGAENSDIDVVPLFFSRLTPMGTISAEAFEMLTDRMISLLKENGPWDGVLLAQHGAAVSEVHRDADGEFTRRVREALGPDVPIGVSLDMHANLSPLLVEQATVVNTYITNPHLDPRPRAREVADLIAATIRGEVQPTSVLVTPPIAVDILRQGTSDSPMKELVAMAREEMTRPGVLSVSVVEGFPWADTEEMGMAFLAVTDGDEALAAEIANKLARAAWDVREQLVGEAWTIEEALIHAAAADHRPVVMMDVGDNVGGGSPGDSTHILEAAQRLGTPGLFHMLHDPASVQACIDAGVGSTVELQAGGKTDNLHGNPVTIRGIVRVLSDGKWEDTGETHGGFRFYDAGPSALVETDQDHKVLLISKPMGNSSRQQLASVGIDPLDQPIIVAKGVHSPRGSFEPIAAEMMWVNTPGCTSADLSTLQYKHRRSPMFPWEEETTF